jgi:hypothetical protein
VIALHNAEEALTWPGWLPPRPRLHEEFGARPLAADADAPGPGLITATLLPALWVVLASRSVQGSAARYSIVVLYGVFVANALMPHLPGAALLASQLLALGLYLPACAGLLGFCAA